MPSRLLNVIHFNDVYKMTEEKMDEHGNALPMVSIGDDASFDHLVAFSERIKAIRHSWPKAQVGRYIEPQGLLLFSGDLFSASVESLMTKGMNMVLIMNELAPDACTLGNHEFDFGRARFNQLVEFCNFPWIISNVKEKISDEWKVPAGLFETRIFNRAGLKIGLIGLMSQDAWKSTLPVSLENMKREEMADVARRLSKKLRDQDHCDLVFALTHAEHKEDLDLAIELGAYLADSPAISTNHPNVRLEDLPGVDAIFGGHNHEYYLGKGVRPREQRGAKLEAIQATTFDNDDKYDDLLVVKSGYDFHDLSEVILEVEDVDGNHHRKKVIKSMKVIRHHRPVDELRNQTIWPESSMFNVLTRQYNNDVLKVLKTPVAKAVNKLKVNSQVTRTQETVIGNWIADCMLKWYRHQERNKPRDQGQPAPLYIMTGGTVRGNLTLEGDLTQHQMIDLLPFDTNLTLLQVKGKILRAVLSGVLSKKSRDRERFPVVSGFKVEYDSHIEQGDPVKKIYLVDEDEQTIGELDEEATYPVLTNAYLAQGGSGFELFKNITEQSNYTQVPMYQVLLFHINDLRTEGYQKRLQEEREKKSEEVQGVIDFVKNLSGIQDDRYGSLEKMMKHMAVWALGTTPGSAPLPELKFPLELGRMKDISGA